MAWYFNSGDFIKAKGRSRLSVAEIKEDFLKTVSKSKIIAVFMTPGIQDQNQPVIYFEYLDRTKFGK